MPLGAAGFEGPSPPELDKSRPGNVAGTWPTQHVVRAGRAPPQRPSQPRTNGPQLGQLQAQALPPGRCSKQTDQAFHSSQDAFPSSVGGQGREEPQGVAEEGRVFQEPGTRPHVMDKCGGPRPRGPHTCRVCP